ncbi:DUF4189 domain-containing protein [Bradyrhizobium erythrophlei]|uniref:DUF4189 domain-containing protein n=1 Tax=Bradyrhizobium erythrophlei TaxID=1437360 RepID=UPI0035E4A894
MRLAHRLTLTFLIVSCGIVELRPVARAACNSVYDSSCLPEERQRLQERNREEQQREEDWRLRRDQEQKDIERRSAWGAIAYSPSSGRVGRSWNHYFEKQAERDALSTCGRDDCEAVTFFNSCRGVAVGDNPALNGWYDGEGETEEDAEASARETCVKSGQRNCRPVASICSPR